MQSQLTFFEERDGVSMKYIRKSLVLRMARWGILPAVLVGALLLGMQSPAQAVGLRITDFSTTIYCDEANKLGSSAGCVFTMPGVVSWAGSLGIFTFTSAVTVSFPTLGSAAGPEIDVSSIEVASGLGELFIEGSQTGYTGAGGKGFKFSVGGTNGAPDTGSSADFEAWEDDTNTLFGYGTFLGHLGSFGPGPFSDDTVGSTVTSSPYSLLINADLFFSGAGSMSYNENLKALVAEPTSVLLMGTALLSLVALRRKSFTRLVA